VPRCRYNREIPIWTAAAATAALKKPQVRVYNSNIIITTTYIAYTYAIDNNRNDDNNNVRFCRIFIRA